MRRRWSGCSTLKNLKWYSMLSLEQVKQLADVLIANTSVTNIYISGSDGEGDGIGDDAWRVLLPSLGKGAPNLKHLNLSGNAFGDGACAAIADAVSAGGKLVRLYPNEDLLSHKGLKAACKARGIILRNF